jgi:uncharacterized repeat protein (TIGR01451 family)
MKRLVVILVGLLFAVFVEMELASASPWHNGSEGNSSSPSNTATVQDTSVTTPSITLCGDQPVSTKSGSLFVDADENGIVTPGDTLKYQVHLHNACQIDINGVVYTDKPDPNTHLVVGSVQVTTGTVIIGNNPGDTSIRVDIGSMSPAENVDISYLAVIANPFPKGVITVTNQGIVSTTIGTVPTNDPNHPGPTVITVTNATQALDLTGASGAPQCVLPGSSYNVTWTVANVGGLVFPGGVLNTLVTGSGTGPLSTAIPAIPTGTATTVTETVLVSEPVLYGAETVTVTGHILTSTAVLATHICAPDFRTSSAHVTSTPLFAGAEFTYTWRISNTGDAAAPGVTAVLTLPTSVFFTFQDNLTSTAGTATFDPIHNTVLWTGNIPVGGSVTIVFNAQAAFGLPHVVLMAPFEVDHPYRPPFIGEVTYDYPYKLFFMLVLKDASPTHLTPR